MTHMLHVRPTEPSDTAFLGYALADYRVRAGLREDRLLAWLGRPAGWCPALELAARPDPAAPTFDADVAAVAGRFGLAPARLAALLRALADDDRPWASDRRPSPAPERPRGHAERGGEGIRPAPRPPRVCACHTHTGTPRRGP